MVVNRNVTANMRAVVVGSWHGLSGASESRAVMSRQPPLTFTGFEAKFAALWPSFNVTESALAAETAWILGFFAFVHAARYMEDIDDEPEPDIWDDEWIIE